MSKKVKKEVVAIVKNELKKDVEYKQHTDGYVSTPTYGASAGAIITNISAVTQGIGDVNRVGDEYTLKHLKVRGLMQNGTGATSNPFNDIRVLVFQYNSQDNNPVATELLLTNVISGGTVSAYSARNQDYIGIYNVLYDKTYHLETGTANAANFGNSGSYARHIDFNVPLKYAKKKIQFEAASATNAVDGIYMCVIGNLPSVATNPTVAMQWAISFTDS